MQQPSINQADVQQTPVENNPKRKDILKERAVTEKQNTSPIEWRVLIKVVQSLEVMLQDLD